MTKLISGADLMVLRTISTELSKQWHPDWYCQVNGKLFAFLVMLLFALGSFFTTIGAVLFIVYVFSIAWIHRKYGRYPGIPRWAVKMDLMDDSQKQRLQPILARIIDTQERDYWSCSAHNCFFFHKFVVISEIRLR